MTHETGDEPELPEAMEIAARHAWLTPHLKHLKPVLLADRPKGRGRWFVLRLVGRCAQRDIDVVLKGDTTGTEEGRFEQLVAGHQFAYAALGASYVPKVLSVDLPSRSFLMPYVNARTAQDMLDRAEIGLADPEHVMGLCGDWLRRLHTATLQETRKINPNSMLSWMTHMHEAVHTRSIEVPRRDLFLKYAGQVPLMAERARGKSTVAALAHGDMNLRNLLINQDHAIGIDFGPTSYVATAHDVAKLLVRYHGWFDPDPECAPRGVLARLWGRINCYGPPGS